MDSNHNFPAAKAPDPTPPQSADLSESRIIELLAFALLGCQDSDVTKASPSASEVRDLWQSDASVRKAWREYAKKLVSSLEESGLRIRSSDARKVVTKTEWIRTVPPRSAYGDEELG